MGNFHINYSSLFFFLILSLLLINSCSDDNDIFGGGETSEEEGPGEDLDQILERDTLRAITIYSSTSYFLYRGLPMGYEYELLEELASHLDVELEIFVAENMDSIFSYLAQGKGDLIAQGLAVTKGRTELVDFTEPHTTTEQVLVQRIPGDSASTSVSVGNIIRNPVDLLGEEVHVQKSSHYYQRLVNLSEEIGGDIDIVTVSGDMETEELIRQVAEGKIDFTVADKRVAELNASYYDNLDIETPVSFPQQIAWAVRKNTPNLKEEIDEWMKHIKTTETYYNIYDRYFKDRKAFVIRRTSEFFTSETGRISEFDDLYKKYAPEINWDWRLLASQVYQESRFRPRARSWAGARGLMQLMPATGREVGLSEFYDPEQNIKAGVKYLEYLQRVWAEIPDSLERIKFILASYNTGAGHVGDARRLAEKNGKDPDRWNDHVDVYMLEKSNPEYFNDPVVKYGYARGLEPYNYVKGIVRRYQHYMNFVKDDPEPSAEVSERIQDD